MEKELRARLPEHGSQDKNWVDPFLGFRARWNLTEAFYLTGRTDVGGFGVGSDLTWQASASAGYRIGDNWSVEAGYRWLDIDYSDNQFAMNLAERGMFFNVGYDF